MGLGKSLPFQSISCEPVEGHTPAHRRTLQDTFFRRGATLAARGSALPFVDPFVWPARKARCKSLSSWSLWIPGGPGAGTRQAGFGQWLAPVANARPGRPLLEERRAVQRCTWIGCTSKRLSSIAQGCRAAATLGSGSTPTPEPCRGSLDRRWIARAPTRTRPVVSSGRISPRVWCLALPAANRINPRDTAHPTPDCSLPKSSAIHPGNFPGDGALPGSGCIAPGSPHGSG